MRKFITGFTLIFLAVFALDIYPGLRGGGGWQWALLRPENLTPVVILGALLVVYVLGALFIKRTVPALAWAVLGGTVLAVAVVGVNGDPFFHLFTRTVSPVQTGASALAVRILAQEDDALERWTEIMDEAYSANLIHFTTSPPGQPLFHQAIANGFDAVPAVAQPISRMLRPYQCSDAQVMSYTNGEIASAGVGMLMPLLAALAVIPLFFAVRDLSGSDDTARRVALWFPLVPAVLLFAPTWNTLYPALCVLAFALLVRGVIKRRQFLVLLAGMVMSVTTFLNFAVLPVLVLFGLFILGYWYFIGRHERLSFVSLLFIGIWFGLGLGAAWAASGLSPFDVFGKTLTSHKDLVQRNYFEWLILHPYDTALFMGLPLSALAVWGMVKAFRKSSLTGTQARFSALDVAAIATAMTVILLNVSGLVQGENGRILSFYAPFLLISAAVVFPIPKSLPHSTGKGLSNADNNASMLSTSENNSPHVTKESVFAPPHVWGGVGDGDFPLLVTQALTVLVMAATLYTVPLDLNPQPTSPRTDIGSLGDELPFIASNTVFDSADYAGQFTLNQYRYIGDPGAQAITFELIWSGQSPTERPYQFELVAYAENEIDGKIQSEPFRWYAQGGNYLPSCWREGDVVRDTVVLPLPPVSMPVVWDVHLRAIDERTGDVMRVTRPERESSDFALLGPVKYP